MLRNRTDPIGMGMGMLHPVMQRPRRLVERTRWLWLVPLVIAFVAVFGWVASHDPGPGLALTNRGWLTIVFAAVVLVLITAHRGDGLGHLTRMLVEYAVVFALAVLVTIAATSANSPAELRAQAQAQAQAAQVQAQAQAQARAAGACPPVIRVRAWLSCLWHQAGEATKDQQASSTTTTQPRRR
jgi:hypothetical protein